ncbi:MAG: HAD-IA family hydrolase [Candidatus Auribacterota bacterium]|nr:HAD-IA family hydrolase [Candidatus Auribacterota bacterium]
MEEKVLKLFYQIMKNKKTVRPLRIRAVLFDFDGTLTLPGALDFSYLRRELNCPKDEQVLDFIESLPSTRRRKATDFLKNYEMEAAAEARPNPAAGELVHYLREKGLKIGIVSRNLRPAIIRALRNFADLKPPDFDLIISRDNHFPPKPSGEGITRAAHRMGVTESETVMVGDYIHDIQAGRNAGTVTVFLDNRTVPPPEQEKSDYTIHRLRDLKKVLSPFLPLPVGKLSNKDLPGLLRKLELPDRTVLIKPGIGEDTAAVNIENDEVLVLTSDPITFATDSISRYTLLVNANDIATSGAAPRWLLVTALFPPGTTLTELRADLGELRKLCRKEGISIIGGHTEITPAVNHPVLVGTLAGTVSRTGLIDKKSIRKGDLILLTKALAVEGTALIAREFPEKLKSRGMTVEEIDSCRRYIRRLSILPEARIAASLTGISGLHDVTEGGLATALRELSIAGGHRLRVDMEKIPIFPRTKKISHLLNLDPLGLIASGSLLICCRKSTYSALIKRLKKARIRVSLIGEMEEKGKGVRAFRDNKKQPWPDPTVDEIARLFEEK